MMTMNANCPLCTTDGGELLWKNEEMRVIFANEPDFPGFCRVIWTEHIAEMSQLSVDQRARLNHVLMLIEKAVLEVMSPDKVNLAALGNMVPHLHWHVIPRFEKDVCFPGSVWSEKLRVQDESHLDIQVAKVPRLKQKIHELLGVI
jgi:diadenosine tetraphosphate (Ap4A) HIT family hydrolase